MMHLTAFFRNMQCKNLRDVFKLISFVLPLTGTDVWKTTLLQHWVDGHWLWLL